MVTLHLERSARGLEQLHEVAGGIQQQDLGPARPTTRHAAPPADGALPEVDLDEYVRILASAAHAADTD